MEIKTDFYSLVQGRGDKNKMGFAISKAYQPTTVIHWMTAHPRRAFAMLYVYLVLNTTLGTYSPWIEWNTLVNRIHCCNYNLLHNCIYLHIHTHTLKYRDVESLLISSCRAFPFLMCFFCCFCWNKNLFLCRSITSDCFTLYCCIVHWRVLLTTIIEWDEELCPSSQHKLTPTPSPTPSSH